MSAIRKESVRAALVRSLELVDCGIHNNFHEHHEFRRKIILGDKSLTKDEITEALIRLDKTYDRNKVRNGSGTKRICENCNQKCLATLYCELCVRNYLKANFLNWTSGNDDIDNLIRECQMETLMPEKIIEWIPYSNFRNIKYLTKGGCSRIYTAGWINGGYDEWNSKEKKLKRFGSQRVVLKKLEYFISTNRSWFGEAKSHLIISNKWSEIVRSYGLSRDPSDGNYILVVDKMDMDLRSYLQQYHDQLTWKERIQIVDNIINALEKIHQENLIHKDLHSGNVLYSQLRFDIGDLGLCGSAAEESSKSVYGNLPYVAPELFDSFRGIHSRGYSFASDIYSIGILMWEISSGQSPFNDCEHDLDLAITIFNGKRPKVVSGTPPKYERLMKQCWAKDPLSRPKLQTLLRQINDLNVHYQNKPNESIQPKKCNNNFEPKFNSRTVTSKILTKDNNSEPKFNNRTLQILKEEQDGDSKLCGFSIPDNIEELDSQTNNLNLHNQNKPNESIQLKKDNNFEPKFNNRTLTNKTLIEEEQDGDSKLCGFSIPDNIEELDKLIE